MHHNNQSFVTVFNTLDGYKVYFCITLCTFDGAVSIKTMRKANESFNRRDIRTRQFDDYVF